MKKQSYFKLMCLNKIAQEIPVAAPKEKRYSKRNENYLNFLPNGEITLLGSSKTQAKPLPPIKNETLQQAANRQAQSNAASVNNILGDNAVTGLNSMLKRVGDYKRSLNAKSLEDLQKRLNSRDMWRGSLNNILPSFKNILDKIPANKRYLIKDIFFRQAKNTKPTNNTVTTTVA